ncbi:CsiV family protein [Opacimonas viscosa]|uniref:Peptidoglycan binding protein CsiV n=1 Tax=Opacimonas viscosa TaxID=2961944 RepID=A0AA42BKC4_9ALTE|nr:CsiV family protein [Opacimonas viscosa]MCP3427613.1 peptidoglycan binding protein CsiV [Opacimonas viscosa]
MNNYLLNTASSKRGVNALKYHTQCILISLVTLFSGMTFEIAAQDAPDWWFDVEVLVVKHSQADTKQSEIFPQHHVTNLEYGYALMSDFLQPDIRLIQQHLPICPELSPLTSFCQPTPTFIDFLVEWLYDATGAPINTHINSNDVLPVYYDGYIPSRSNQPHFLPKSSLSLTSLSADLRWDKTMSPLLHVAWRQPVAEGENNAVFYRIQAGANLQERPHGEPHPITTLFTTDIGTQNEPLVDISSEQIDPSSAQMVTQKLLTSELDEVVNTSLVGIIKQNLTSPETVAYTTNTEQASTDSKLYTPIYELDGGIKVFIKYYSGVPYLHVVGDMLFASKNPDTGTVTLHPFQQRRRIISKQVHYFDHPYFGLVITLTRHKRPALQD